MKERKKGRKKEKKEERKKFQLHGHLVRYHVTQKVILFVGLFPKEITLDGGGQGGAHKVRGWASRYFL